MMNAPAWKNIRKPSEPRRAQNVRRSLRQSTSSKRYRLFDFALFFLFDKVSLQSAPLAAAACCTASPGCRLTMTPDDADFTTGVCSDARFSCVVAHRI
jgi:hypothetical protein